MVTKYCRNRERITLFKNNEKNYKSNIKDDIDLD